MRRCMQRKTPGVTGFWLLLCTAAHEHYRRAKARDRLAVRQGRERHRQDRGAGGVAHASDQPLDRAFARAQARPPFAPRPTDARRPPPSLSQLPPEERPRGLPLADPRAGPPPLRMVEAGQPAPDFTLKTAALEDFTRERLLGHTTV